jgi:hypothetical protein
MDYHDSRQQSHSPFPPAGSNERSIALLIGLLAMFVTAAGFVFALNI